MEAVETIKDLRRLVAQARAAGKSVGLVPTMGALHQGHFSLIHEARRHCGFVVVSIFVNPTQFGPSEDLAAYPRTPDQDMDGCREHGADVVFTPAVSEIYPATAMNTAGRGLTTVSVSQLDSVLCGAKRPGHFTGVCTVVSKLFNMVQPDKAFFGAKDFQQVTIIRRMVADLNFPLEIVTCPIIRESDGLAMSSRNRYLTAEERTQAPTLHRSLEHACELIRREHPSAEKVSLAIRDKIARNAPIGQVDYIQIVDPETLLDVATTDRPVLIALAVKFGRARLIDNMLIQAGS